MNMPITKTADEERIAELEAQLAARDEALKVAMEALKDIRDGTRSAFAADIALEEIEEILN